MPIYAYQCVECGFSKDFLQKISDPVLSVCPSCNKPEFKKQVTAAGFRLKGSGWYVSDFKGGDSKGAGSATGPSTSNPESAKNESGESTSASSDSTISSGSSGSSGSSSTNSSANSTKASSTATKPDTPKQCA